MYLNIYTPSTQRNQRDTVLVRRGMKQLITVPSANIARLVIIVGTLLLIPLSLTLLNPNASIYGGPGGGFDWMPGDFIVMGALLFAAGFAIEFARINLTNSTYKVAAILGIVATLLIIWVELAVGAVSQLIQFLTP